jgi:hypothetical protein
VGRMRIFIYVEAGGTYNCQYTLTVTVRECVRTVCRI